MNNGTHVPAPLEIENSGRWLGNDGTWSTFYVHVGTPPQHYHVLPSLRGQTVYIPKDEDCERLNITDCGSSRGVEIFVSRPSLGFRPNKSSTWDEIGTYRVGLGTDYGLVGNAVYGYDTVGPSTSEAVDVPTLEHQAVVAYVTPDIWVGKLGLSMFALNMSETDQPHSFLSRLKEDGYIPSLSFGYQTGAAHRYTKVPGSLVLGGYDRGRRSDNTLLVPSVEDTIVGLQSISATLNNGTVTNLLDNGILAVIDTDIPEFWLPPSVCDAFASAFGLTYHEASDRYALTDTSRSSLQKQSPTFSFRIGTSISGGETITIEIPYKAFDVQASYPIFATPTNYFPIRRAANESQYALGRAFLQEVYLTVDWERDVFNISQAMFSAPMPEPDIVTIEPNNKTESLIPLPGPTPDGPAKLSIGAIAGIAFGSVLMVVVLAATGWYLWRRKQRAKRYLAEAGVLPTEVKKDQHGFVPEAVDKLPEPARTELELEGQPIGEMYAPHGESEMQHLRGSGMETETELVEADSSVPSYELQSPGNDRR